MKKAEPMQTLTVSLSPQQLRTMQKAVDSGAYASNSEVVRDALRLWEERRQFRALELERLKQAYDEGMRSGEARRIDADALLDELKAEIRARG